MEAENKPSELTTTLHLGLREVTAQSADGFKELLETLSPEDNDVINQIRASSGVKFMILIARGPSKGSRFVFSTDTASIGRSPNSEIFLDDVTVSRSHATISKQGANYILKDSGSLNGTYVNNQSIEQVQLQTGDEFQIGKFHLVFIGSN